MKSFNHTNKNLYQESGVNIEQAHKSFSKVTPLIQKNHQHSTQGQIKHSMNNFAGIFSPNHQLKNNDLVATTDGVGTKIDLCYRLNYLKPLGQDLVAMCVNDLYCMGAIPMFFLDYIACETLEDTWYIPVLESITKACSDVEIALLGGETAEHPGTMKKNTFDLAGFCVGSRTNNMQFPKIDDIHEKDILVALPSSGLHSNGFSLVRHVISQQNKTFWETIANNSSFVEQQLLTPTKIYKHIPNLIEQIQIKAIAHITGGGLYENIARILPKQGYIAIIEDEHNNQLPTIFSWLAQYIDHISMYQTFNMGYGMVLIIEPSQWNALNTLEPDSRIIGCIEREEQLNLKKQKVYIRGVDNF